MPDVYSIVKELAPSMQDRLAGVLETRGADPQQQAMRRDFLSEIPIPGKAEILEVGCGTGVLTRMIARHPAVARVVGVDPAPSFLAKARELAEGLPNIEFEEADGRSLPFAPDSFDVVVFDSTLCHVPSPEPALAEAFRVLRRGGCLAVFDGDYATATVGLGDHDPLQACVAATMSGSVNDRWLVRRLPALVGATGFEVIAARSHGFVDRRDGGYMTTVVERGADLLQAGGQIGPELAAALKAEVKRRAAAGLFFGHVAYGGLLARKP